MKRVSFYLTEEQFAFVYSQAERRGLTPAAFAKETVFEKATRYEKGLQPWEMAETAKTAPLQRRKMHRGKQTPHIAYKRRLALILRSDGDIKSRGEGK